MVPPRQRVVPDAGRDFRRRDGPVEPHRRRAAEIDLVDEPDRQAALNGGPDFLRQRLIEFEGDQHLAVTRQGGDLQVLRDRYRLRGGRRETE